MCRSVNYVTLLPIHLYLDGCIILHRTDYHYYSMFVRLLFVAIKLKIIKELLSFVLIYYYVNH